MIPTPPETGNVRLDEFNRWVYNLIKTFGQDTFDPVVTLVGGAGNTVPTYPTEFVGRSFRMGNLRFVDIRMANSSDGTAGAGTGHFTLDLGAQASAGNLSSYFPCGTAINGSTEYNLFGQIGPGATTMTLATFDGVQNYVNFTGQNQNDATTRRVRLKFFYEVEP